MLKRHIKLAIRALYRNKEYTLINILGFIISLTVFILISQYVYHEISYDSFHKNYKSIYRAECDLFIDSNTTQLQALSPSPLGSYIKSNTEFVDDVARIGLFMSNTLLNYKGNVTINRSGIYADSSIFNIFSFDFISVEKDSFFSKSNHIVISENFAKEFLKEENPIGKIILLDNNWKFKVVGVFKSFPSNSIFQQDFITSIKFSPSESLDKIHENWNLSHLYTYLLIKDKSKLESIKKEIQNIIIDKGTTNKTVKLKEFRKVHMDDHSVANIFQIGDKDKLRVLILIAFLIIIISAINYINLAISYSTLRKKEIGIKKQLGASLFRLKSQFIIESVVITSFSVLIAIAFAELLLPYFSKIIDTKIYFTIDVRLKISAILILFGIFIGILAGIYPSVYLSSFKVISLTKYHYTNRPNRHFFKRLLVVFQFVASIVLIVLTIVLNQQIRYLKTKSSPPCKDKFLTIDINQYGKEKLMLYKFVADVNKLDYVKSSTLSYGNPFSSLPSSKYYVLEDDNNKQKGEYYSVKKSNPFNIKRQIKKDILFSYAFIDSNYIKTYGYKFTERFIGKQPVNTLPVIINEAAKKILGWDKASGKYIYGNNGYHYYVTGVLEDFAFSNLKDEITPLMLGVSEESKYRYPNFSIRLKDGNIEKSIKEIEAIFNKYFTKHVFNYWFLDNKIGRAYQNETSFSKLLSWMSAFALFIASLGIFGLVSFSCYSRSKEIGIRKIHGASTSTILTLILKETIILILISIAIAWPASYFISDYSLNEFAYRINIPIFPFIISAILAFFLGILSSVFQIIRTNNMNPTQILRYE